MALLGQILSSLDIGTPPFASSGSGVTSFDGRTGAVVPLQADYDAFFLTPAEGNAAYGAIADVAANTAKVTNATHTGQMLGATALSAHVSIITAQPAAGALVGADTFLVNDGGVLSEISATDMATFFGGGGGDVFKVGTPVNDQVGIWTGDGTLEGDVNLTFSGDILTLGSTGNGELRCNEIRNATQILIAGMDENDTGLVLNDGARLAFLDRAVLNNTYFSNEGVGGSTGTITMRTLAAGGASLVLAGPNLQLTDSGLTAPAILSRLATPTRVNFSQSLRVQQGAVWLQERAAADTDETAYGQFWVLNTTPNAPMFTGDTGVDSAIWTVVRINGLSGTAGPDETLHTLIADSSANSTTALVSIMSTLGVGVGTWAFKYKCIYRTAALTTGIGITVNHTGTISRFNFLKYEASTVAAGSNGIGDDEVTITTGAVMNAYSSRVLNAVVNTIGVATANSNNIAVIEGVITVTATGQLDLRIQSEVGGSAVTMLFGTCLELKRLA